MVANRKSEIQANATYTVGTELDMSCCGGPLSSLDKNGKTRLDLILEESYCFVLLV